MKVLAIDIGGTHVRFLNAIEAAVSVGRVVHVILGNYATHKHPKVLAWLSRHPRFVFHFTLLPARCGRDVLCSADETAARARGVPLDCGPSNRDQALHCRAQW
jgi:hypothetical protein